MKYLSIDTETTSLNINKARVIQFGMLIEDTKDLIPVDKLPSLEVIITQPYEGDKKALEMNQDIFRRMSEEGVAPAQFLDMLFAFLKSEGFTPNSKGIIEITCAGKNFGSYDMHILNNMPGFKDRFHIRSRVIDPAILYWKPQSDNKLPDLKTCLQRAGINKEVTHTAKADAADIVALLRKSNFYYN